MPIRLVADRTIAHLEQLFPPPWQLTLLAADEIGRQSLQQADALLVRTTTQVGADLLEGSSVRFVGTASSGTDHLDMGGLQSKGIEVADGAGGNARAVVEHVVAVLAAFMAEIAASDERKRSLQDFSLGLIGCGRIGGQLRQLAHSLGVEVRAYDPWRADCKGVDLPQVLSSQLLSLHVPLVAEPPHPTRHQIALDNLLHSGTELLINTARGEVLESGLPSRVAEQLPELRMALDVWCGEPHLRPAEITACWRAGAHRAGHSLEGQRDTLLQVARQMAEFWQLPPPSLPPLPPVAPWQAGVALNREVEQLGLPLQLTERSVGLLAMDGQMRNQVARATKPHVAFQQLRALPVHRRSFSAQPVYGDLSAQSRRLLEALGFPIC